MVVRSFVRSFVPVLSCCRLQLYCVFVMWPVSSIILCVANWKVRCPFHAALLCHSCVVWLFRCFFLTRPAHRYLNFGVTLLLLGSQDGNVRRVCLNSSLQGGSRHGGAGGGGGGGGGGSTSDPAIHAGGPSSSSSSSSSSSTTTTTTTTPKVQWLLVDEDLKVCDQGAARRDVSASPLPLKSTASGIAADDEDKPAQFQQSLIECTLVTSVDVGVTLGCATTRGASTVRSSHCGFVFALAVADGFICSGGGDGFIKLWSTNSLRMLHLLRGM